MSTLDFNPDTLLAKKYAAEAQRLMEENDALKQRLHDLEIERNTLRGLLIGALLEKDRSAPDAAAQAQWAVPSPWNDPHLVKPFITSDSTGDLRFTPGDVVLKNGDSAFVTYDPKLDGPVLRKVKL